MKPIRFTALLAAILLPLTMQAQSPVPSHVKTLFYMLSGRSSVKSFAEHKSQISVLVPAWYSVNADGLVAGTPEQNVLLEARAAHIPVIPIVGLANKEELHKLFNNPQAQAAMNAALVRDCKLNGYAGFQIDFENISWTDRDALTALVKTTAQALHSAGLQLQIATVPNAPGYPGGSAFSRWIYEDWRGAYDLKALAKYVDLICLMTYDQHTRWTVPGPVAGWQWTLENLKYALKYVPKNKLSLGIPLYGYHWYTGDPGLGKSTQHPNPTANYISGKDALFLLHTFHGHAFWDPIDHTSFFWFYRDQMREWVFYTDKRTFKDRYDLAKQYGLWGTCAWVLGQEDPSIWSVIPPNPATQSSTR
jgi:spore germination protein YaaH